MTTRVHRSKETKKKEKRKNENKEQTEMVSAASIDVKTKEEKTSVDGIYKCEIDSCIYIYR